VGVAGFMTAATMYLSDISTPLNRARTLAPPSVAFSAGASIGPAIGGVLADTMGIPFTFFTVGAFFGLMSVGNQLLMPESSPAVPLPAASVAEKRSHSGGVVNKGEPGEAEGSATSTPTPPNAGTDGATAAAVGAASSSGTSRTTNAASSSSPSVLSQWKRLMGDPRIRSITLLQGGYWFVLSGSQMTLMPLMLVGDQFHMSASHIGGVFATASVISVVCTPLSAKLLDSIGQVRAIVPACLVVGATMAVVPMAHHDVYPFLALFFTWTTAGTLLSGGPTAYVSNVSTPEDRGQALALLRTGGDVGMLLGAVGSGALAGALGSQPLAIMCNGVAFCLLAGYTGAGLLRLEEGTKDHERRER
jgi:MFS family permease